MKFHRGSPGGLCARSCRRLTQPTNVGTQIGLTYTQCVVWLRAAIVRNAINRGGSLNVHDQPASDQRRGPTSGAFVLCGPWASAWPAVRLNASSGATLEEASLRQMHRNTARVFDNLRLRASPKATSQTALLGCSTRIRPEC